MANRSSCADVEQRVYRPSSCQNISASSSRVFVAPFKSFKPHKLGKPSQPVSHRPAQSRRMTRELQANGIVASSASTDSTRIGFLGLGIMGVAMVGFIDAVHWH